MVLRLAATLDVPLRQQNALLLAAGFAPAWPESDLTAPELARVSTALDYILTQQEPYPAVVVDRRWKLLRANQGAKRLTTFLSDPDPAGPGSAEVNLAELLVDPAGLRRWLVNWQEVAVHLLRGVQADLLADGTAETQALLQRLLAYPDLAHLAQATASEGPDAPVLAMHFQKDGRSVRLFTTIATLGTPRDVTLQELRIESFFPADGETATRFQSWAAN